MTEYNRANRPRHHESAGERPMQVDRQPSPWPCVLMLAGLLLFCLAVPYYWQHDELPKPASGATFSNLHTRGVGGLALGAERSTAFPTFVLPNSHFDFGNDCIGCLPAHRTVIC